MYHFLFPDVLIYSNYRQCKKATLINEKDDEHQSPLWYAFFNKAPPNMVKILMQNGARITESGVYMVQKSYNIISLFHTAVYTFKHEDWSVYIYIYIY